jgi:6-phosphogluconolactonase
MLGTWGSAVTLCETPEVVASTAAGRFVVLARTAIATRGRVCIALAGGQTPEALYRLLAQAPCRDAIDWNRVEILWGDERCVPPDHPDSNYRMAREALLGRVPIPADNVHRMRGGMLDSIAAAREYEEVLRRVCRVHVDVLPRLDLCLLGLGPDGHTASLFPASPAVRERKRWVRAGWVEKLGSWRLTLTPPVINNARHVLFLVTGRDKAEAVRAVLQGPAEPDHLPAQIVRAARGRVEWLLDRDAAGRLSPHARYHHPSRTGGS